MITLENVLGSRTNILLLRYLSAIQGSRSGNELAKCLGLQQSSARKALERLVAAGVVTRVDIGRTAAYSLATHLAFVQTILLPLFHKEQQLRITLINRLSTLSQRLHPRPHAVILFGSLARGARDFQDIDLLFVTEREEHKPLLHEAVAKQFESILIKYLVPISPIVVTVHDLKRPALHSIVVSAQNEGILLTGTAPSILENISRWTQH